MIESKKYDDRFFTELEANSYKSAKAVLPVLYQFIQPRSVVDVGCGTGTWLKVWDEDLQVKDYLGVEGPYVKPEMLKVAADKVVFKDLKEFFDPGRRFDLAMSMEVAEHLPDASANQFIRNLTSLSDIVLFSAAVPDQQGTYHINEQYPEYWARHFRQFNFVPVDCIRPLIWNNAQVEYWYQQNTLLYVNKDVLPNYENLAKIADHTKDHYLTRIHPFLYELKTLHIKRTRSIFGFLNWKWYVLKQQFKK
jgi:SAM-dependent methyltransferase